MKKIAIISCSKRKKKEKCQVFEMYSESILFSKTLKYCKNIFSEREIFVLSAKYGLLGLNEEIEPYDKKITDLCQIQKNEWTKNVFEKIETIQPEEIYFFTGLEYFKPLKNILNCKTFFPLKGMGIGQRLKFLT